MSVIRAGIVPCSNPSVGVEIEVYMNCDSCECSADFSTKFTITEMEDFLANLSKTIEKAKEWGANNEKLQGQKRRDFIRVFWTNLITKNLSALTRYKAERLQVFTFTCTEGE